MPRPKEPFNSLAVVIRVSTLLSLAYIQSTWALGDSPRMTRVEFDALFEEISNWGRWGSDDQLGTLNLITPAVRQVAAGLVREGVSVSMQSVLDEHQDELNPRPFERNINVVEFGGQELAIDRYEVSYHGWTHTHIDGLQHFAHQGGMYNGVPFADLEPDGTEQFGMHYMGQSGIVTRGVLVDLPRFLGLEYLAGGTAILASDLEAWEKATGVTVQAGDALMIRTGRWKQVSEDGEWDLQKSAAGPHASLALWLKGRGVAVIGFDTAAEVIPSGVDGTFQPFHEVAIAGLGMPIVDNLELEAVAEEAAARDRQTFMFVAAPLRVPGGTGAPINPLAIF